MAKLKIWVDDLRDPATKNEAGEYVYVQDPENWHWAKTITEAIRMLSGWGVEEVSIDHDIMHAAPQWVAMPPEIAEKLGPEIMEEIRTMTKRAIDIPLACPEDYTAVAHFIAEMPAEFRPKAINVHTANPTGAKRLLGILEGKVDKLTRRMALP